MFSHTDKFFGEYPRFESPLLGLGWVSLCALVGLDDVAAGFVLEGFEVREIAVKFSRILAD